MRAWLHSLRLPNLLMVWIFVLITGVGGFQIGHPVSAELFLLGLACTFFLMAGNWWNDLLDAGIDEKNRPGTNPFSYSNNRKLGKRLVVLSMILAYVFLFLAGQKSGIEKHAALYAAALLGPGLWLYSRFLQRKVIWKTIFAALLGAIGIWSVQWMQYGAETYWGLTALAFLSGCWRELIKDLADARGDNLEQKGNAVLLFGEKKMRVVVIFVGIVTILSCVSSVQDEQVRLQEMGHLFLGLPYGLTLLLVLKKQWKSAAWLAKIFMLVGMLLVKGGMGI